MRSTRHRPLRRYVRMQTTSSSGRARCSLSRQLWIDELTRFFYRSFPHHLNCIDAARGGTPLRRGRRCSSGTCHFSTSCSQRDCRPSAIAWASAKHPPGQVSHRAGTAPTRPRKTASVGSASLKCPLPSPTDERQRWKAMGMGTEIAYHRVKTQIVRARGRHIRRYAVRYGRRFIHIRLWPVGVAPSSFKNHVHVRSCGAVWGYGVPYYGYHDGYGGRGMRWGAVSC